MVKRYKGKEISTGYYVYGPLSIIDGEYYIDDFESGKVLVYPESVEEE